MDEDDGDNCHDYQDDCYDDCHDNGHDDCHGDCHDDTIGEEEETGDGQDKNANPATTSPTSEMVSRSRSICYRPEFFWGAPLEFAPLLMWQSS